MRVPSLFAFALIFTSLAASSAHSVPMRLAVTPSRIELSGPSARHGLLVSLVFPDGRRRDVTDQARVTLTTPGVAVATGQELTPRAAGSTVARIRYRSLSCTVPVVVNGMGRPARISFVNDVIPTLARIGCSSGTCHGANSGKGGFKLSLRGYAPELDYLSITRQYRGRRVNRSVPEASLFLRKPTMTVSHGGGRVLDRSDADYRMLLAWIEQGAPGPEPDEPRVVSIAALPGDRVYARGEAQRCMIVATYSDGHREDVTRHAIFRSNDEAIAQVSPDGRIVAMNPGSTAIQAKYGDKLAVLRVAAPYPLNSRAVAFPTPVNYIDRAVYASLRQLRLEPSPKCADSEFIRRVFVDLLGTLPTALETRAFLDSHDPQKRHQLIDAVLKRPEYGDVWALKLCDLFLMRKEHMERKNTVVLRQWLADQFRSNRPWDQVARDLITAVGSTADRPQTLFYISRQSIRPNNHGWIRHPELTGEITAQVFLGTRIQCARCHNHPTERYTQDDYYHFASVFAQVNGEGEGDPLPERLAVKDSYVESQPRTGEKMAPRPLDRSDLRLKETDDRRVAFAEWLTRGAGRTQFSRAICNRLWDRLFGNGIVDPVDDMRSTNPPRNEALLDSMARDLIAHGYDLKYLLAEILRSNTYQASAVPTPVNRVDTQFFSHYNARRLPAEEMLDAVAKLTGVPDRFATYPLGTRAIELSDIEVASASLDTFGRPSRVMPIDSERCSAPSISQALEMLNGEELQRKLKSPTGSLALLLKREKDDAKVIEELFLGALSRRPGLEETKASLAAVRSTPRRDEGFQDLLWALINSKEFLFNH